MSALEGFRKILDAHAVVQMRAVATSAVREASSGEVFLDRIRARTGLAFEVIKEAWKSTWGHSPRSRRTSSRSAAGAAERRRAG